jgi:DNA-binding NarL/FixJ family response regulator
MGFAKSAKCPRILLVEDDVAFRETLQEWLGRRGYAVSGVGDAEAAIALSRSEAFDAAVIDVMLPGASGLQLQQALLEEQPDLAIIFLTGEATLENAVEALREWKAFDFLTKPLLDPTRLRDAIDRAIARPSPRPALVVGEPEVALAPREREILDLLLAGMPNAAIAESLCLSERTVRNRLSMLYSKLGVRTRTQAVLAFRPGTFVEP